MAFLTPLALLAGLVIPGIILLYMLKKRTRPITVSSIMLWQRLERTNIPALRLSRLLRNLLLALQLLVALLLVLALARPVLDIAAGTGRNTIIIIDTSISMAVEEQGGTRLEQSLGQVRSMVSSKSPGDRIAVIAMGEEAKVLSGFNAEGPALLRALDLAVINSSRANPDAALALAENMARAEEGAEIILFSDGAFGQLTRPPDFPLSFAAMGSSDVQNLMIEDLVPDGERVYVSVYNNGTVSAAATVRISDKAGEVIGRREVELAPGQRQVLVWRNLPSSPWYRAEIVSEDDQLDLDNYFYALAAAPVPSRLLLVSEGNLFLERALMLSPGLSVSRVAPEAYRDTMADMYDIYVLDGYLPAELPNAPSLVFDPPHPNLHFSTGPIIEIGRPRPLAHPLLSHVDFTEVSIGFGKTLFGGSGILESDRGLLATEYMHQGQPLVVFGFAVQAGDLPLRPAFPILLRNILESFSGPGYQTNLLGYGQAIPAGAKYYLENSGSQVELAPGQSVAAGIYTIVSDGEEQIAVNSPAITESLAAKVELDSPAGTVRGQDRRGGMLLLWPLVLAALVLVGLEWWVDNYGS